MNILSAYCLSLLSFEDDIFSVDQDEWIERIRKEWKNSMNYPRKKKKSVRKRLSLEYSIASWNPLDDL